MPGSGSELLGRILRDEVTLVDTRPVEEYRAGHLPGARSIPLDELPGRVHEIPRDREVVAYCRGPYCPMASQAVGDPLARPDSGPATSTSASPTCPTRPALPQPRSTPRRTERKNR